MALVKIFSGSEIQVQALGQQLRDAGIESMAKDHIESGRLAGFVALDVDLYVEGDDVIRARQVVESFVNDSLT